MAARPLSFPDEALLLLPPDGLKAVQQRSAKRLAMALGAAIALGSAAILWLKALHEPSAAIEVSRAFLGHLEAHRLAQAFALTTQDGTLGNSSEQFASRLPEHRHCGMLAVIGTSPRQSNGNRLRRWIAGRQVEPPEVSIEFSGKCIRRASLRRNADGQWRISNFGSHAG